MSELAFRDSDFSDSCSIDLRPKIPTKRIVKLNLIQVKRILVEGRRTMIVILWKILMWIII